MNIVYLEDWAKSKREGMMEDFGITEKELEGADILLAGYTYKDYEGNAFVLFKRDGKLFEVNGSHCSCYGLSEADYYGDGRTQWEPEETTVEALRKRIDSNAYEFRGFIDIVEQLVESLEGEKK